PRLLAEGNEKEKTVARSIAVHVMKTCMNLLHPYTPFISEEIWYRLKNDSEPSSVVSEWPQANSSIVNKNAEAEMSFIRNLISAVRNIRSEMNVPPGSYAELKFKSSNNSYIEQVNRNSHAIMNLAKVKTMEHIDAKKLVPSAAVAVVKDVELFVPLAGLIDLEVEKNRLSKEIGRLDKQVEGLSKKLRNEQYLQKAPENVVQQDRDKLKNFTEKLEKLKANLNLFE
ncbi:MAG: class I tRNA ligase family protein, partial [Calditrichia bacterium]|nr:class I tRNA ligase family protein [Calditrichia bacterium]